MEPQQPTGSYDFREKTQETRKKRRESEASARIAQSKRRSLDDAGGPKPKQKPKEPRARTSAIARLFQNSDIQTEHEETVDAIFAPVVDIAETVDLDETERICIIADDDSEQTERADSATEKLSFYKLADKENVQNCKREKDEAVADALDAMAQTKGQLAVVNGDLARQSAKNSTLQASYDALCFRLEATEKERDSAKASIETLEANHAEDLSRLRDQHEEDDKRSEAEKEQLRLQLERATKRIEEQSAEISHLQASAAEHGRALATDQSRLRNQHEDDRKRWESEKGELKCSLMAHQSETRSRLPSTVTGLQTVAAERERALTTEKKTVSNLRHEVATLEQELKDRDAEARRREAEKKTAECEKHRLKKEADAFCAQANDLDHKLKESQRLEQKERSSRRKEEDEHRATQRKLEKEKAHHEDTEKRLQRRNEEIARLRAQLREAEVPSCFVSRGESKHEPPALDFGTKRKLQAAEEHCKELKEDTQRLDALVRKLERELLAAQTQQKSNDALDDELLKKDLRITELENTLKSIDDEADGLRHTIEIMTQELREQEDKWRQNRQALVEKGEETITCLQIQLQNVEANKETFEHEKTAKDDELVWKQSRIDMLEKSRDKARKMLARMNEAFKSSEIERIIGKLAPSSGYSDDTD